MEIGKSGEERLSGKQVESKENLVLPLLVLHAGVVWMYGRCRDCDGESRVLFKVSKWYGFTIVLSQGITSCEYA